MGADSKGNPTVFAAQHALFWLTAGNLIGLWLAFLLLFPEFNSLAGEFSYGRIVPLHLNFQLYGWTSLPLVGWLFHLYSSNQINRVPERAAVLVWTSALGLGAIFWLTGHSSGKVFLEWQGFPRIFFALALLFLWCVLAARFWRNGNGSALETALKGLGLISLLVVAPVWYWAASPSVYPAVNPDTSGPTAASLLGSTLSVVLVLLLIGPLLGESRARRSVVWVSWAAFAFEICLFALADKSNVSHRSWFQPFLLGSLLIWVPIFPAYFRAFYFPNSARLWLYGFLGWLGLLTITGWVSFLPRILDSWKFTNALVAHSHLAMAGFVTSFNMFLIVVLCEKRGLEWKVTRHSAHVWNIATFTYILSMWISGTMEAADPGFTILPGSGRTALYSIRAICGVFMLACSFSWWRASLGIRPRVLAEDNFISGPRCIEIPLAA